MKLLTELKRRNVFRMAGLYLVAAWLIAQVGSLVLTAFDAPDWVLRVILVALAIGFIPALVFVWVFELTPDGFKRGDDVPADESIRPQTAKRMNRVFGVLLAVAVTYFAVDKLVLAPLRDAELVQQTTTQISAAAAAEAEQAKAIAKSIAVLPFVDMSQDATQAYFADGISEEILNALVRVPGLKVAGRTSSFAYKGRNEDLRKISSELGVNHILEGSVRRSDDKLRITAQLIRSEDGFHLWSETFDRELADVFVVQEEIARTVADKLQLSLGLGAKPLVTDTTQDIVAYEKYLQAKQLHKQRGYDNLRKAELLLSEVVARDPGYAPAWSALAGVYGPIAAYAPEADINAFASYWSDAGLAAAKRAIALAPDGAESLHALGSILASRYEWIPAFEALDRAAALAPDDANILDSVSQALRETGYHEEAKALSLRAVEKEPRVAVFRNSLGNAYWLGGDAQAARQQYKQAIAIDPGLPFPKANLFAADICIGEADEALALAHAEIKAGRLPPDSAAAFSSIQAPTDTATLVHALSQLEGAAERLAWCTNPTAAADAMDWHVQNWSKARRAEPGLFDAPEHELWQHPRWKAQVRKDGVLDLWRARGFPPQCKPVAKDDFECTSPGIKR